MSDVCQACGGYNDEPSEDLCLPCADKRDAELLRFPLEIVLVHKDDLRALEKDDE